MAKPPTSPDEPSAPEEGDSVGPSAIPEHASPYPLSRLAPAFDLIDVAREIQEADKMLGAVVGGQLDVIAKQIQALQEQAQALLEKARVAAELHRADCHFKKRPGHVYHLYRRPNGSAYFSMLSPKEWGGRPPHRFEGSYRLEIDQSWTSVLG